MYSSSVLRFFNRRRRQSLPLIKDTGALRVLGRRRSNTGCFKQAHQRTFERLPVVQSGSGKE